MKNGFIKILAIISIVGGLWNGLSNKDLEFKNINFSKSDYNLNNKDELADKNDFTNTTEIVLVNKEHGLDKNYKPEGLIIPNIEFADKANKEEMYVAKIIVDPLEALVKAGKDEGIILLGNSAYRSYKLQESIYENRVRSEGKKLADAYVAKPGFSEHQTGLCIDITNQSTYFVKGTKEADWLAKNCCEFGFIIRYPEGKKNITGVEYEPWHIRYVGEKAAKEIYENGITLEEYLAK